MLLIFTSLRELSNNLTEDVDGHGVVRQSFYSLFEGKSLSFFN